MKLLYIISILSASLFIGDDYIESIHEHWKKKSEEYKTEGDHSPFHSESKRESFKSIKYFEPNETYRVLVKVEDSIHHDTLIIPTYSNKKKTYVIYGILHFKLGDKEFHLKAYQNLKHMQNPDLKPYIFIPFTDLTCGGESYGGGRYLDHELPLPKPYYLDFNKAYSPYCAYDDGWNCTVPPQDNFMDIEVRAGEMYVEY